MNALDIQRNYYDFREKIRSIYRYEPYLNTSLVDNILSIKDDYDSIVEVKVELEDSNIFIVTTNSADIQDITYDISEFLTDFIKSNLDKVEYESKKQKENLYNFVLEGQLLFDIITVGNTITFFL